jgi:hypothetical protein
MKIFRDGQNSITIDGEEFSITPLPYPGQYGHWFLTGLVPRTSVWAEGTKDRQYTQYTVLPNGEVSLRGSVIVGRITNGAFTEYENPRL